MKNIIGILLLLLLLLIGTCVYQKTYTLYTLKHSDDNTTQKQEKQLQPVLTSTLKKIQVNHDTGTKPVHSHTDKIIAQKEVVKEVQVKYDTTTKPVQVHTEKASVQKEAEGKTSILEKIKTSIVSAVTSEDKKDTKVEPKIQATPPKITENKKHVVQPKLNTQLKEKEVVEYLLKVLKERDATLTQRDDAENKLQALIKAALQEREVAIETMEKEHKERLKNRDETAKSIYQKYTENKGK